MQSFFAQYGFVSALSQQCSGAVFIGPPYRFNRLLLCHLHYYCSTVIFHYGTVIMDTKGRAFAHNYYCTLCLVTARCVACLVQVTLHFTCIDLPEGDYAVIVRTYPNYAATSRTVSIHKINCKSDE